MRENKMSVLDWPRGSLNLNPIEHRWNIVKKGLGKMYCTINKNHAIKVWYHDGEKTKVCTNPLFLVE